MDIDEKGGTQAAVTALDALHRFSAAHQPDWRPGMIILSFVIVEFVKREIPEAMQAEVLTFLNERVAANMGQPS